MSLRILGVDKQSEPQPLGDLILDLLWERMAENSHVEYKLKLDLSKGSDFPELAKDIFAMSNRGGGWIFFGFNDDKKRITPVGIDDTQTIDQADIGSKFNSFSSDKLEIGTQRFVRNVDTGGVLEQRTFVAFYIPPSTSELKPIREGFYMDSENKKKVVFRKDEVLVRRGTQSVLATDAERALIKKRVEDEAYAVSLLSGRADNVQEVLYSNLLRVLELPRFVYEGTLYQDDIPMSRTGIAPFAKRNRTVFSFCKIGGGPVARHLMKRSIRRHETAELLQSLDGQNLITHLLNLEVNAAMKTRGMLRDAEGRCMFFPTKDEIRYEGYEGRSKRKPRIVAKKRYVSKVRGFRWLHHTVSLDFKWIAGECYLRVAPGLIVTGDGRVPVHDALEGTAITSILDKRYNQSYLNELKFWISKIPHDGNGAISLGDRVRISPKPIGTPMSIGLEWDRPSREQKAGIPGRLSFDTGRGIRGQFIAEPKLVFGGRKEEEDPRIGMKYFGPFHAESETPLPQVKVGILGTGTTRALGKRILEMLSTERRSPHENRFLYPEYPGFSDSSSVKCKIEDSDVWGGTLTQGAIEKIIAVKDTTERIRLAAALFADKVKAVSFEDNRPHVALCMIPTAIDDYCGIGERTRGAKRPRFTKAQKEFARAVEEGQTTLAEFGLVERAERSYDLHDAIKGKVMGYGIPVQLLKERKAEQVLDYANHVGRVQDPATFSWNLSAAMYYKADGKPWRLAKLEQGTCYIGIAFYKRRDDPLGNLRVSMAQVFTHSGDGFVLRGSQVKVDRYTREPHLPTEDAESLVSRAIETYKLKAGTPSRVVVHKTSRFDSDERAGVVEAIALASADLVCIRREPDIRFVRTGRYPPLRGTLIELSPNECLLFTTGYIPRLRTYPGHAIPIPLHLHLDCDSEMDSVASEVMKLTKIDWNTTQFSVQLPITIIFPQRVGNVLSEMPDDAFVESHYRFYM